MAAHVRVYYRGSGRLLTGRVFPEDVSPGEAKRLTDEYRRAEGLDGLGLKERFVQKADYSRHAHHEGQVPSRGVTSAVLPLG